MRLESITRALLENLIMNHPSEEPSADKNQNSEPDRIDDITQAIDPAELVNQRLERQPTIDLEEAASNLAISPQMLNEGDNLRGDLKRE